MKTYRRVGWALACGALVALSPAAGATASASGVQSAIAMQAAVATAYIAQPFEALHDFEVTMVAPVVAVGTPSAGSVDVTRTWAGLSVKSCGCAQAVVYCNSLSNPLTSTAAPEAGIMSFDASCNDGSGFLFYRVSWKPVSTGFAPTLLGHASSVEWTAGLASTSLAASTGTWYVAQPSVCGFDGVRFHCVNGDDPTIGHQPGNAWASGGITLTNFAVETATD